MIDLTIIGLLIALIIGVVAVFSLTHKVLKVVLFVAGYIFVVSLIIGTFVYLDAQKFGESMNSESILFVIVDQGEYKNVIPVVPGQNFPSSQDYLRDVKNEEWDFLLNDFYKLFFVDVKIFEDVEFDDFELSGFNFTAIDAQNVLTSQDPYEFLPNEFQDLDEDILRASFFSYTIMQKILMEDPLTLIKQIKENNIWVYKETAMFRVIKYIPEKTLRKAFDKAKDKVGGVVDEFSE